MNVLLDLDGTLADPCEGIINCLKHALMGLSHGCPSDVELERYIGPPLQESFAALLGSADSVRINAAVALYRQRFLAKGMFENAVCPRRSFRSRPARDHDAVGIQAAGHDPVRAA